MKLLRTLWVSLVMAGAMFPLTAGADSTALGVADGGVLRVEGTSTLHSWSLSSRSYRVSQDGNSDPTSRASRFDLNVPVAGLTSGENGLDKNMRNALNAKAFPNITFRTNPFVLPPAAVNGAAVPLKLSGVLSVAGVDRPVEVDGQATSGPKSVHITGSTVLAMSDYKVKPPVLMFGTIRTGDKITVRFDLDVELPK